VKLKTIDLNGTTYAEVQDGKPVYEADDGKVIAFDAPHSAATIKRLNDENKAQRQFEAQYKPIEAERNALKSQLHGERLGTAFSRSKYIADKLAVPVDIVQARFGSYFGVGDDGKIQAKGPDGNPLYSRARPGEEAGFDEAMEILVEAYPHRESILKGSGASGGGAGGSRSVDGKRTIPRSQFDAMSAIEQSTIAKEKNVAIVD
jgi:hypothetical protein